MIHGIFKEDFAQTFLARYDTPPKIFIKLFMSNSGGRKRVVDELQYVALSIVWSRFLKRNAEDEHELIVQNAFLVNVANSA